LRRLIPNGLPPMANEMPFCVGVSRDEFQIERLTRFEWELIASGNYIPMPCDGFACKSFTSERHATCIIQAGVSMLKGFLVVVLGATLAQADIALLLEEPYGSFGGMNPTGHAAIYLSRVCAATPVSLRRCRPGETGSVLSRYHRVGGYDWIAIPPVPYLYAVEHADQVPASASPGEVTELRDRYRRMHLDQIVPDEPDGSTPKGDWTQLVGEAYDRTIYAFEIETTADQDDELIRVLNATRNQNRFHLLYRNCADFTRNVIDLYYPKAISRNFASDVGIMTPRQAAKRLVRYSKKHPDLQFSSFVIAQIPGTVPRSKAVRGVLESVIKSKRYVLPLAPLAVLHPAVGGGLIYALLEGAHFDPRRVADADGSLTPKFIVRELRLNGGLSHNAVSRDNREPPEAGDGSSPSTFGE
jgi:hypothetical protein